MLALARWDGPSHLPWQSLGVSKALRAPGSPGTLGQGLGRAFVAVPETRGCHSALSIGLQTLQKSLSYSIFLILNPALGKLMAFSSSH